MADVDLTFDWKPHAKQRPRAGKNGVVYTPKATKDAEAALRAQWPEGLPPCQGPLSVTIYLDNDHVHLSVCELEEWHEAKKLRGDIDNYAKTILDAFNGIAWEDDSQIDILVAVKS